VFPNVPPAGLAFVNQPSGLVVSPDRDLAYCFAPLVAQMLHDADTAFLTPAADSALAQLGFERQSLNYGFAAVADATQNFIKSQCPDCNAAFAQTGWSALPPATQLALLAMFGELFISAYFSAARDITQQGSMPPRQIGFTELVAMYRWRALGVTPTRQETPEAGQQALLEAKAQVVMLEKTVQQLQALLEQQRQATAADTQRDMPREE